MSRYVLAWQMSMSLDASFCLEALEMALQFGKPEMFNTDQGAQFTGSAFAGMLKDYGIDISMDGRGRCMDNIFTDMTAINCVEETVLTIGSTSDIYPGGWLSQEGTPLPRNTRRRNTEDANHHCGSGRGENH